MTDVELVFLEETPSSLMGSVGKIVVHDDIIFVLTNKGDMILKFYKDGEFLSRLKNVGDGPEEYRYLNDFVINDNLIIGLDSRKQKVLQWDLDFNFRNSYKLGFWSDRFATLNTGFVFDTKFHLVNDSAINLVFTDNNFVVQGGALPFEIPKGLIVGAVNVFTELGGATHFQPSFNDTIYKIDMAQKQAQPVFRFEYGELWKFNDEFKTDQEFFKLFDGDPSRFDEMILSTNFLANDKLILQTVVLFPSYKSIGVKVDQQKKEVSLIDFMLNEDVRNALKPIYLDGERVFVSITSDNLQLILKEREDLRQLVDGQNMSTENPILLSFKIKK